MKNRAFGTLKVGTISNKVDTKIEPKYLSVSPLRSEKVCIYLYLFLLECLMSLGLLSGLSNLGSTDRIFKSWQHYPDFVRVVFGVKMKRNKERLANNDVAILIYVNFRI